MKKLTAKEVFTREAYEGLTAEERRSALKVEQAKSIAAGEPTLTLVPSWWTLSRMIGGASTLPSISERLCLCSNPLLTWELTKAAARCNIRASGG